MVKVEIRGILNGITELLYQSDCTWCLFFE